MWTLFGESLMPYNTPVPHPFLNKETFVHLMMERTWPHASVCGAVVFNLSPTLRNLQNFAIEQICAIWQYFLQLIFHSPLPFSPHFLQFRSWKPLFHCTPKYVFLHSRRNLKFPAGNIPCKTGFSFEACHATCCS